jgi:hypothetical protein
MRNHLTAAALISVLAACSFASGAFAASTSAPANTTAPAVSGTPKVGQTLTVSDGTWSGSPTSYAYQWQRCTSSACANIAGATSRTYKIGSADAGRTLRAVVSATNADGTSTANSNQTPVVAANGAPANTGRPTIGGDAYVGQELTADNGSWTGSPTSFTYQWLRCDTSGAFCFRVAGATGRTYGVRFADVYGTVRVAVTAKNADGSRTIRSLPSDVVQPVQPVVVPGNKAPSIRFISLKRRGVRVYARFSVCDDAARRVSVIERDSKRAVLSYVRKYAVVPTRCVTATRSWVPASRFRTKGRLIVTLRAVDKSGASSRFVHRSLVYR